MTENTPPLNVVLRNDEERVSGIAVMFREFCEWLHCPSADIVGLELALVEALNNILRHGAAGRTDVEITVSVRCEGYSLIIELADNGTSIPDVSIETMPEPLAESSRGLPLIHACVDEVIYTSNSDLNVLLLKKSLPHLVKVDLPDQSEPGE